MFLTWRYVPETRGVDLVRMDVEAATR
jgi:hypothetical protein